MAQLNKEIFEEFQQVTSYNLIDLIRAFGFFTTNNYSKIIGYFNGDSKVADAQSFKNLDTLKNEITKVFEIINQNNNRFNNYKWWVLIEELENIKTVLDTTSNASRWLRSSITEVSYSPNSVNINLKQGQTLEALSREVLGDRDWNNAWINSAVSNNLREEDYTNEGGNFLRVVLQGGSSFFLQTVVDNLQGDAVYGKDLQAKLSFEDDDLKVLQPFDTFVQTIGILSRLKRKDNPEFPDQGLDERFAVGVNINLLNFPSIVRQITNSFATDDTIKNFSVVGMRREQDALYIDFEVQGRIGDIQQVSVPISG